MKKLAKNKEKNNKYASYKAESDTVQNIAFNEEAVSIELASASIGGNYTQADEEIIEKIKEQSEIENKLQKEYEKTFVHDEKEDLLSEISKQLQQYGEKEYILPQIIPTPQHINSGRQEADKLHQALQEPYKALNAEDKIKLIEILPQAKDLDLSNLSELFQNQDKQNNDAEFIEKVRIYRQNVARFIKENYKSSYDENNEADYINKINETDQTDVIDETDEINKIDEKNMKFDSGTKAEASKDETFLQKLNEDLNKLTKERPNEEEIILSNKSVKLPSNLGYKYNLFSQIFKSFFSFGKEALNSDLKIFTDQSEIRLIDAEMPFLIACILNIACIILWKKISLFLDGGGLIYQLNFIISNSVIPLIPVGLSLIFAFKRYKIKTHNIFGSLKNNIQNYMLLYLSFIPLAFFAKAINNISFYYLAKLGVNFNSDNVSKINNFITNNNYWQGQSIALIAGIIIPCLLYNLLFRGLILGQMLNRSYGISTVAVSALAAFLYDMRIEYLFVGLIFSFAASLIRYVSGSLNMSILINISSLFLYHFSDGICEVLSPNTSYIDTISGDRIIRSSFFMLFLSLLALYPIYTYTKSLIRQENIHRVELNKRPSPAFTSLFLISALICIIFKIIIYF